jgi:ActR/RegA family two-component response regulator
MRKSPGDDSPLKLLIVDDDEGDRKQLLRLVKRSALDCDCIEAATMAEALAISEQIRFDCVIVDYHLPQQNGLEGIVTMLRRDAFLPVLVTTGQGSERLASQAIKLGAMDYVSKADLNASTIQPVLESVIKQAGLNRKFVEQQTALTVFAKVLVHDLKAPIQSILGYGKLIETFVAQSDFDKQKVISLAQHLSEGACA